MNYLTSLITILALAFTMTASAQSANKVVVNSMDAKYFVNSVTTDKHGIRTAGQVIIMTQASVTNNGRGKARIQLRNRLRTPDGKLKRKSDIVCKTLEPGESAVLSDRFVVENVLLTSDVLPYEYQLSTTIKQLKSSHTSGIEAAPSFGTDPLSVYSGLHADDFVGPSNKPVIAIPVGFTTK